MDSRRTFYRCVDYTFGKRNIKHIYRKIQSFTLNRKENVSLYFEYLWLTHRCLNFKIHCTKIFLSLQWTLILKRFPILHVNLVLQWKTPHLISVMAVQGLSLYLAFTCVKWVPFLSLSIVASRIILVVLIKPKSFSSEIR